MSKSPASVSFKLTYPIEAVPGAEPVTRDYLLAEVRQAAGERRWETEFEQVAGHRRLCLAIRAGKGGRQHVRLFFAGGVRGPVWVARNVDPQSDQYELRYDGLVGRGVETSVAWPTAVKLVRLSEAESAAHAAQPVGSGPAPTVTDVEPSYGSVEGGDLVTITGTNFVSGATVAFGGTDSSSDSVMVSDSNTISCSTPEVSNSGKVNVVVTNPDSQSGTLTDGFTYEPYIDGLDPNEGPITGGTLVQIYGGGFEDAPITVMFGGESVPGTWESTTSVKATTPYSGVPGPVDVTLTNQNTTNCTQSAGFTYEQPSSSSSEDSSSSSHSSFSSSSSRSSSSSSPSSSSSSSSGSSTSDPQDATGDPEPCNCSTCCGSDSQGESVPTSDSISDDTDDPVRYVNGEMRLSVSDLQAGGFGLAWGHTRSYRNQLSADVDYGNGYNWQVTQWPYLAWNGDTLVAMRGGTGAYWFAYDGSTFTSLYGGNVTLVSGPDQTLVLTLANGGQEIYDDFSTSQPGLLVTRTTAGGQAIDITYTDGQPSLAQRTWVDSAGTHVESFLYSYLASGDPNAGRLASITLQRQLTVGGLLTTTAVRRCLYTYYTSGQTSGALGDLQTAERQVMVAGDWATVGTCYYRYWTGTGDGLGFRHGLKYVFQPGSYARLQAAVYDAQSAADSAVAPYADNYFEYDSEQRVTREDTGGGATSRLLAFENASGSSSSSESSGSEDPNQWVMKTTEQAYSNGALVVQNVVYTNSLGQVLLKDSTDGQGREWIEYQQFDDNNNLVLRASPAAVAGYSATAGSLDVSFASGGVLTNYEYYPDGDPAAGYLQRQSLSSGDGSNSAVLADYTYDASGPAIVLASKTTYRDEAATQPITTSYQYAWHAGTSQISEQITTLPAIGTGQNGDGVSATQREIYDTLGNMIWECGPRGFVDYFAYDVTTGAQTQQIEDVNSSDLALPEDLVDSSQWTTPAGGGAHLITDTTVDDQGRPIQVLGPTHPICLSVGSDWIMEQLRTATWTIYRDDLNEVWTSLGYGLANTGGYAYTLVNPVTIQQFDGDGRLLATIQAPAPSIDGPLSASYSFPQSTYTAWSTQAYDASGRLISRQVYNVIPAGGAGSQGTNYDQSGYGYDGLGRQNKTVTPGGTITRTVFDALNRPIATYVGTNDAGATDTDPTGGGTMCNNMVCTQTGVYDSDLADDGNLTSTTAYVDNYVANNRVTQYGYDWRDRQTSTAGPLNSYQQNTLDNLGNVIQTDQLDGGPGEQLLARSQTLFDDQGRTYQTIRWEVDPTTGALGNQLASNTWYDEAGNVIKSQPAGSQTFTKFSYDGVGRRIAQYTGYYIGSGADDPTTVDQTNKIFEQTLTEYDPAGNVLLTSAYQRWHNTEGYGPLYPPGFYAPEARMNYTAMWYDSANRLAFSANYGTNGGAVLIRPDVAPPSGDSVLVTFYNYGQDTDPFQTIDPAGTDNRRIFDRRHRVIRTIANNSDSTAPDTNNSVLTSYSPDGQVASLTAINPTTGNQGTVYTYGTTLAASGVTRSDLLASVTYPDGGVVHYQYNRQGQVTQMTDQNGTLHHYAYDLLGRQVSDSVFTPGSGIDSSVLRIARTYNALGRPQNVTSYDSPIGGNVVNDILYQYNGFGQIIAEYQNHSGAVNTSSTPAVQYAYADGSENTVRLTAITYPSGGVASYSYGYAGDDGDMLSRVQTISLGSVSLAEYTYLGLNTFVQVDYPEPAVRYDLAFGIGSNPYPGLDNFGRVIDSRWRHVETGSDVERVQYGYDVVGNRLWRHNTVAPSGSGNDERYTYDGLRRLVNFQRGQLSPEPTIGGETSYAPGLTGTTLTQQWSLDATGNWSGFISSDALAPSEDLNQTRTHTTANEIVSFAASYGATWSQPVYDAAGNMITFPQPDSPTYGLSATYDAWNRQMSVVGISDYAYDGINRRITKTVGSTVDEFYYSSTWQVLEDRQSIAGSAQSPVEFIWGPRYIDDLVCRQFGSERLFALQDANWNVTAIIDSSGVLQERYRYQAYGTPEFLVPSFDPSSGQYGSFDWETLYASYRFDPELGTYQVRNRELHPLVGIWLSRDPVHYRAGINLHAYCRNLPTAVTDPSGTQVSGSSSGSGNFKARGILGGLNPPSVPFLDYSWQFDWGCDDKQSPSAGFMLTHADSKTGHLAAGIPYVGATQSVQLRGVETRKVDCPDSSQPGEMWTLNATVQWIDTTTAGLTIGIGPFDIGGVVDTEVARSVTAEHTYMFTIDCCCPGRESGYQNNLSGSVQAR